MNEQDILDLIERDPWMMNILRIAEKHNLPDWVIGAGFVRNKVWDYLHGFNKPVVDTADIDLVYYDPIGNDLEADRKLSRKLKEETGLTWEVVNEFYAHTWNNLAPYTSTEDALSQWPETVTAIGVRLHTDTLKLVAPHGIDDLVNFVIRQSPGFNNSDIFRERVTKKEWLKKWPKLKVVI